MSDPEQRSVHEPWWLGDSRWAVAAVIAVIAAVVSALDTRWIEAALFFAAALVLAIVMLRATRR